MGRVLEINDITQLEGFRWEWGELLRQTPGASFFQSLDWLEVYWRHFGRGQSLRALVVLDGDRPAGIVPLAIRTEATRVGRLRVLNYPLHDWGSFYGPIGPDPAGALTLAMEHVRCTPRNWDVLELRWQGAPGTEPEWTRQAMRSAGFQAYQTVWNQTAVVDCSGGWESYWASRKGAWLRRFRHVEDAIARQGAVSYVRYRPLGVSHGDGSPRWDLYDACEELARRSWQGHVANGTTLSHDTVRAYLRETHEKAAAAGAVDLNLLLLDGSPAAFVYGYHYQGYVYGLRRGYDPERSRKGAGNVLLARVLRDGFDQGDRLYDMGVGSLETKRHFQTRLIPIYRCSHYPPSVPRTWLLRFKRWRQVNAPAPARTD